jgi:hypothetical protein
MKMDSRFRGNDEEKKGGSAGAALFRRASTERPV